MHTEQLVKMANDIGNFFNAESDKEEAVRGIVDHIRKFWDPRMKRALVSHVAQGGAGLSALSGEAAARLKAEFDALKQAGDG